MQFSTVVISYQPRLALLLRKWVLKQSNFISLFVSMPQGTSCSGCLCIFPSLHLHASGNMLAGCWMCTCSNSNLSVVLWSLLFPCSLVPTHSDQLCSKAASVLFKNDSLICSSVGITWPLIGTAVFIFHIANQPEAEEWAQSQTCPVDYWPLLDWQASKFWGATRCQLGIFLWATICDAMRRSVRSCHC